jgi:hypothetical protein
MPADELSVVDPADMVDPGDMVGAGEPAGGDKAVESNDQGVGDAPAGTSP